MSRTWSGHKFGYIIVKDSADETKSLDDSNFTASPQPSPKTTFRRSSTPITNFQDGFVKNTHNVPAQSKIRRTSTPPSRSYHGQGTSSMFRYAYAIPLSTLTLPLFADTFLLSRSRRTKIVFLLSLPCIFLLLRIFIFFPSIFYSEKVTVQKMSSSSPDKENFPAEERLSTQWHHNVEEQIQIIFEKKWYKLSEEMKSKGIDLWQRIVEDQVKGITVSSKATAMQVAQLKLDLQSRLSEKNSHELSSMERLKQLKLRLEHFEEKSKHLEELFLNHKMWCNKQVDMNVQLSSMVQELKTNLSYMISLQNSVDNQCARTITVPNATPEEIKKIVGESLSLYNSDKTGLVDYALESAGGSIVDVHGTETYAHGSTQFTIFGVPFWKARNSPRAVIQPQVHPGECWAMRGSAGSIIIRLFSIISPTAFSLEHIPKNLAPMGIIDSAPKDFSVLGLTSESDNEGHLFGTYTYTDGGDPLQTFHVQNPQDKLFSLVELRVHSNHGNSKFTCLYRFRVHGVQK